MASTEFSNLEGPPKKKAKVIDPLAVSESLGYRIYRRDARKSWSPEEDEKLKRLIVSLYMKNNNLDTYDNQKILLDDIDWNVIKEEFPHRKAKDCRKRWTSSLDPTLRRGKWTEEEDARLLEAFERHGPLWRTVAQALEGRTDDQCSKRYLEVLNPDTKDRLKQWTLEEDLLLISKVKEHGTKWRTITASMNGRPSLTCRNRWRKIMTDIAKNQAKPEIKQAVGVTDNMNISTHIEKSNSPTPSELSSKAGTPLQTPGPEGSNNNKNREGMSINGLNNPLPSYGENESRNTSGTTLENNQEQTRYSFQRQPLARPTPPPPTNDSHYFPKSPALGKYSGPSRTSTEWNFKMINPQTNEELPQFTGPISTQEQVHRLIELAKYNGVFLTVHQHIHHHYAPQSPALDPVTAINRYQHFNYLPPLTEVPKLTSSVSAENSTNDSDSGKVSHNNATTPSSGAVGDAALMRLLNNENHRNSKYQNIPPYAPSPPSGFSLSTARSPKQQAPGYHSNSINRSRKPIESNSAKKPLERQEYMDGEEGEEEEMDFWDSMSTLARSGKAPQPQQQQQAQHQQQQSSASPSSFNGELRSSRKQQQQYNNGAEGSRSNISSTTAPPSNSRIITGSMNSPINNYHMLYYGENGEEEEEEEEIEQYANHYGMFYNVLTNNKPPVPKPSSSEAQESNNDISAAYASGYIMPFNPS